MAKVDVSKRDLLISAVVAVATFAVYAQVIEFNFVIYDDNVYVYENERVRDGLTTESVIWAVTSIEQANWHPVTWWSHMVDCTLFGVSNGAAGWHHLVNVAIHLVNSLLTFWLIRQMSGTSWTAGFVAAIFALHPLHVESVAWIAERKDVLSSMFWLLSMLAYLSWAGSAEQSGANLVDLFSRVWKHRWYWVSFTCLVLGLMAKPMLVTAPFLLLLLDYWPLQRPLQAWNKYVAEKLPMFVVVVFSCVITYYAQKQGGAVKSVALDDRVVNVVVSYARYFTKLFWPVDLAVLYPYRQGMWQTHDWVIALALLIFISVAVWWWRKQRALTVGWLWFLGTLVPVIGLVHIGNHSIADRYMYVPMLGLLVMLVFGLCEVIAVRPFLRRLFCFVAPLVIVACATLTWCQIGHWKNSETLFRQAVEVTVDNTVMHTDLGVVLQGQGKLDEAISHFRTARKIDGDDIEPFNNLGVALHAAERLSESIAVFEEALSIHSNHPVILKNLGLALSANNQPNLAIDAYRKCLEANEVNADVHAKLGNELLKAGQLQTAVDHFRLAVSYGPEDATYVNMLGAGLHQMGQLEEALAAYQKAVMLDPELYDAVINLSEVLAETKQELEGMKLVRQALSASPNSKALLQQFARLQRQQGDLEGALATYRQLIQVEPENVDAHNQAGNILASQSLIDEAVVHYREAVRLQPAASQPKYNLALMFHRAKRLKEAIQLYREVIRLDSNLPAVHNNLGVALEQTGDLEAALRQFRAALALDPAHASARRNLQRVESQ